jgi:hypothetical protein
MRCLDDGDARHQAQAGVRLQGRMDMETLICTRGRNFPSRGRQVASNARAAAVGAFLWWRIRATPSFP